MRQVEIHNVTCSGRRIDGVYPVVDRDNNHYRVRHPKLGVLKIPKDNIRDNRVVTTTNLSYEELLADIAKRFAVLEKVTTCVVAGTIRALIVSGATGVGKTYPIEKALNKAQEEGSLRYTSIRGVTSTIGMYQLLYQNRHEDCVLLVDDTDTALTDADTLNIWKACLDTTGERIVSYNKDAHQLRNLGIPQRFSFKGRVIFITNIDIDAEIASGSKLAPHLSALISRCIYVNVGLHSKQALMARVEDVCKNTDMLKRRGITEEQADEAILWLKENSLSVRSLSLRTAIHLANLIVADPVDWKAVAAVTLINHK